MKRNFSAVLLLVLGSALLVALSSFALPPWVKPAPPLAPNIRVLCSDPGPNATAVNFYCANLADTAWTPLATVPRNGTNDLQTPFTPLWGATNIFVCEATNSVAGTASQYSQVVTNIAPPAGNFFQLAPPLNFRCGGY